MKISISRLKAFISNPERYRLEYILNISPVEDSYALIRGKIFHTIMNLKNRGYNEDHILAVLNGSIPDTDGKIYPPYNDTNPGPFMAAVRMADELKPHNKVLASEVDFDIPIPGSPHGMRGRIDVIYEDEVGLLWVGEYKTASAKQYISKKQKEWLSDRQADYEIIGARALGFDVYGLQAQYVVDSNPVRIWEPIEVSRTEAELARTQLYTHQICETIEMYTQNFGPEQPWIHLNNWPCDGGEWCPFRSICERESCHLDLSIIGNNFKRREPSPFEILEGDKGTN